MVAAASAAKRADKIRHIMMPLNSSGVPCQITVSEMTQAEQLPFAKVSAKHHQSTCDMKILRHYFISFHFL
jgi:hypothetical protein